MGRSLALKVGVLEIHLRLNQIRVLPQCVVVQIANALVGLVAVGAGVRLFAGVHQVVRVEVAPREEGLVALVALVGSLGHVRIVGAHMGAQIRFGGPRLAAHGAVEDARLRFARVHTGVRDQLGAQHKPSIAQLADKRSLGGVQRCEMIAQAVPRCETFRAHLALVAQPIAQPVHRYHMQLQLKVTRELLLALGARTQRLWRPAPLPFRTVSCFGRCLAWRSLPLGRLCQSYRTILFLSRFLGYSFLFGGLQWFQINWQMDGRVQGGCVPGGNGCVRLLLIAAKQIRQIQRTYRVSETSYLNMY